MAGLLKRLRKRLEDLVRAIDLLLQPEPDLVPVPVPVRNGRGPRVPEAPRR